MEFKGIPLNDGIVINKVLVLEKKDYIVKPYLIENPSDEIKKLDKALNDSYDDLSNLINKFGEISSDIFESHKLIVKDPVVVDKVKELIISKKYNAAFAYKTIIDSYISLFKSLQSTYMSERTIDIEDVSSRILRNLSDKEIFDFNVIDKEVILVTNDLTPSEAVILNPDIIKGVILAEGGRTSHTSIIIKSLGIPVIIGVKGLMEIVKNNDLAIIDCSLAKVMINPDSIVVNTYLQSKKEYDKKVIELEKFKNMDTMTEDFYKIDLLANVNCEIDIEVAKIKGARGIGLFRTEFLYLEAKSFPTEDEQFLIYEKAVNMFPGKKVIIRTFDLGGDKELKYLKMNTSAENEQFNEGLKLSLLNKDILITQIRAILRASIFGDIRIMLPMVKSLEDLLEAKEIVKKCEMELVNEGAKILLKYQFGIMVEHKNIIKNTLAYAKEVDFFSIGTNDLLKSIFDIDRKNDLSDMYQKQFSPKFLNILKDIVNSSIEAGIPCGICGEMASDFLAIPILLGIGLSDLSMNPSSILLVRKAISKMSIMDINNLSIEVLKKNTTDEVIILLKEYQDNLG